MRVTTILRTAIVATLLVPLTAEAGLAALPPEHQRMVEFVAVVEAAQANGVPDMVGPIVAIDYLGADIYEIRGETCSVMAFIRSLPLGKGPPIVGPRQFSVELQPAVCR